VNRLDGLTGVTHIALIDDVVTTMATTQAISRMLREQQDCRIDVRCLARASRTL
jgi:predicted amidophosphoribosyltransferase